MPDARTPPQILRTRTLHEGWGRFMLATVRLDDGTEAEREIEDHGEGVAVLPYDPDRRTALLVRVLRAPLIHLGVEEPHLLEAPAGIREDEPAPDAARREALEETGVQLDELEGFGAPFSSAGVSTERVHLFLGAYARADRVEAGGGVEAEHENLRVIELPLAELWSRTLAGRIDDLKTVALCLLLHARRPELFAPA